MTAAQERQVWATECEYGADIVFPEDPPNEFQPLSYAIATEIIDNHLPRSLARLQGSGFTSNGARFYVDHDHPEYSAPLTMQALAAEIAGERIVHETFRRAQAAGVVNKFALNKRVISHNPRTNEYTTWGYHENYLCRRARYRPGVVGYDMNPDDLYLLGMHLAVRNLYAGAGCVMPDIGYAIAQKVLGLTLDFNPLTTGDKPLVNLRDEPHTDYRHLRQHVTCGDPNMSPWGTLMKAGTTRLALSIIEHRHELELANLPESLMLKAVQPEADMVRLAQLFATDLTMRQTVEMANGKRVRPLNISEMLLTHALELEEVMDFDEKDRWTLSEWERALSALDRDPMEMEEIDWVAKLDLITKFKERRGIAPDDWSDPRLGTVDRLYDNLDPERGIGLRLRATHPKWQPYMPPEEQVAALMTAPPQDTRAKPLGEFVALMVRDRVAANCKANWGTLEFPDFLGGRTISLEPFDVDVSLNYN